MHYHNLQLVALCAGRTKK